MDDDIVVLRGDRVVGRVGDVFVREHAVGGDTDEEQDDGRGDGPGNLQPAVLPRRLGLVTVPELEDRVDEDGLHENRDGHCDQQHLLVQVVDEVDRRRLRRDRLDGEGEERRREERNERETLAFHTNRGLGEHA